MKNKKIYTIIIIVAIFFLLFGVCEIVLFSRNKDSGNGQNGPTTNKNNYIISDKIEEEPNTQTYTNEVLASSHCLQSICVLNATFHYNDEIGRVDYSLENHSSEMATGFLKMVFGNQSLIISYQDLAPGNIIQTSSYYRGKKINNMEDYHLEELTDIEKSKIVYTNK